MFPAGEGPAPSDGTTGEADSSGPPPRFHLLRYHGILAPYARDRGRIVPIKQVEESTAVDRDSSAPPYAIAWGTLSIPERFGATTSDSSGTLSDSYVRFQRTAYYRYRCLIFPIHSGFR